MKKILMVIAGAMSAMMAVAVELPAGYKAVEYIESTKFADDSASGGQYIDTGYVPTPTTRIVADFNPLVNYGGYLTFFGAETGGDASSTGVILRYADRGGINGWFCNARSNEATLAGFFENTRIAAELKAGSITLNGQTAQFATTGTPCQLPIYIFCCNDGTYGGGWARRFQAMRLYSFKIYEGDVLKRDFVPCVKTTTGESGLWDLVERKFYGNAGTGAFLRPLPAGYKAVAYIESTPGGGQYIDTDYVAGANTKVVMDAYLPSKEEQYDDSVVLFGTRTTGTWSEKAFSIQLLGLKCIRFAYNGEYFDSPVVSFGERRTITCDNKHVAWTGSDAGSEAVTVSPLAQSKSTLYIFGDNTVVEDGDKRDGAFNRSVMRLYSFCICEGDDTKRDFVPCVETATGKAGLYDMAEGKFYENKGNDSFRYHGCIVDVTKVNFENCRTLYGGYLYRFVEDVDFTADAGKSAMKVADGENAIFEIPAGVTVKLTGGDASGMIGAGAGIEVPSDATLVIRGEGTLNATGGAAANGAGGVSGKVGWIEADKDPDGRAHGGKGGNGGAGGGGAGAGIGGKGGKGGAGGTGGEGGYASYSYNGSKSYDNTNSNGGAGGAGADGGKGGACGTIAVRGTVSVTAKGGAKATTGGDGAGYEEATLHVISWYRDICGYVGGGGGGGGSGAGADDIGGGGAGGAGGGGGGGGGTTYDITSRDIRSYALNGEGGKGGNGAAKGADGYSMNGVTSLKYVKHDEGEIEEKTCSAEDDGSAFGPIIGGTEIKAYGTDYEIDNQKDINTGAALHCTAGGNGGAAGAKGGDGSLTVVRTASVSGAGAEVTYLEVVAVPQAVQGLVYVNFGWGGIEQTGVPKGSHYTISGNAATDVGTYTATAVLDDGYCWADGSLGNVKEIVWSIAKQTVAIPASRSFCYTGYEITAYADASLYTVQGDSGKATDVGSYTATLALKDAANYKWENGSSGEMEVAFSIHKFADANGDGKCDECGGTIRYLYDGVTYLDKTVNADNSVSTEEKTGPVTRVVRCVSSGDTEWGARGEESWCVVDKSISLDNRPVVKGDVHLILMNGVTLTANKGIQLEGDNSLRIYAQSDEENTMGKLNIAVTEANGSKGVTAIGGGSGDVSCGDVYFYGGVASLESEYAVCIGGFNGADAGRGSRVDKPAPTGEGGGSVGRVHFYGGISSLYSRGAACIGGGRGGKGGSGGIAPADYGVSFHGPGGHGGKGGDVGGVCIYGGTISLESVGAACIRGGDGGDGGMSHDVISSALSGGNGGAGGAVGRVCAYGGTVMLASTSAACVCAGNGGAGGAGRPWGSPGRVGTTEGISWDASKKPAVTGGESEETASAITAYNGEKYISVHCHVWESPNLTFHWNDDHTACTAARHCSDCDGDVLIETATEIVFVEDKHGVNCQEMGKGHYEATFPTIETARTESVDTRPGPHLDADGNGLCDLCGRPPVDCYSVVTADTQTLTTGNWFVEKGQTDLAAPLVVEGEVTLYLATGAVLNATKGIVVNKDSSLTVSGEGDLIAQGDDFGAGIGGANGQDAGTIVLKTAGTVQATGDDFGAGIGGGYKGAGGKVTVERGTVTATGGDGGAGIGGGYRGSSDGSVHWNEVKVQKVEGDIGSGHPYVKFAEKNTALTLPPVAANASFGIRGPSGGMVMFESADDAAGALVPGGRVEIAAIAEDDAANGGVEAAFLRLQAQFVDAARQLVISKPWYSVTTDGLGVEVALNEEAAPKLDEKAEIDMTGSDTEVTVIPSNVIPELTYGLGRSESPAGPFVVEEGGWVQADEKGELPKALTAPKSGANGFYRVIVK